ncbi:MAG: AMP-binding protein [Chloroflexota bacterium]
MRLLNGLSTVDAVDRQAIELPLSEALVDSRRRLSWAEVRNGSIALALGLFDLGFQRDDLLLAQLPNSTELYLLRLACERAGIRLLSIPTAFRRKELGVILSRVRPAGAAVASPSRSTDFVQELRAALPDGMRLTAILYGDEPAPDGTISLTKLMAGRSTRDATVLQKTAFNIFELAWITVTSGSTGTPQCVSAPIYARALTGMVQAGRWGLREGDAVGALSPLIVGTPDALAYHAGPRLGLKILMMSRFEPNEAIDLIRREQAAAAIVVPTMLARVLNCPAVVGPWEGFRLWISSGAPLSPELAAKAEMISGGKVVQAYGTMDFGGICASSVDDGPEVRHRTVGRPLDGNEVLVVNEHGASVPVGNEGRILVRGPHSLAGSFGDVDQTEQGWKNGVFDLKEIGLLDESGNLTLLGRQKEMIIRGGQNIYPAEVEVLILRHPAVLEVAVVGVPDHEMGERACAFVVCRPGYRLDLTDLTAFLKAEGIGPFKFPERLEILDEMPRGPSGTKVDKQFLARRAGLSAHGGA